MLTLHVTLSVPGERYTDLRYYLPLYLTYFATFPPRDEWT